MKDTILGIDAGTSSIKCALYDPSGRELFKSSSTYENIHIGADKIEIDPEMLWHAVASAVREIIAKNAGKYRIAAVGLCAIMIMPVLLDRERNVIRPVIHWFDSRMQKQYFDVKKKGYDKLISQYSGSALTGESTVNALSWIKKYEPENYKRIYTFFMLKDFIRYKLTANIYSDFGDASGTQMLDTKKWQWSIELITELGFNKDFFPELHRPYEIGGYVTVEASKVTGLVKGTPVAIGSGDGITTIFGLGIYNEGQSGITVGSAGVIAAPARTYPEDSKLRAYIFCHPMCDRWFLLMATASSGEIFKWYNDNITADREITYSDLDREAEKSRAGSAGLVFLPYLLGSRNPYSNPRASGVLLGLRYRHKRQDITRAILEGISFELADIFEVQEEILSGNGIRIDEVKLSGGIIRSMFWQQLLADILGRDLVTTKIKELGTLGASIIAAIAAGVFNDFETAVDSMVVDDYRLDHDTGQKDFYKTGLNYFREIYKALEPKFDLFDN
jgi:xylulokinase